jgi:hypothetical protein
MKYWVDHLENHFQTSINTLYQELSTVVDNSQDYDAIRYAQDKFLSRVSQLCFVRDPALAAAVSAVCVTCLKYCNLVSKRAEHAQTISREDLQPLEKEFNRQTSFFFSIISRKSNRRQSPDLDRLVLTLDYNHYFSETAKHTLG